MIKLAMVLMLISASAMAQRTELRSPTGKLLGYTQQEGNRTVQRDPSGNALGYSVREGDSTAYRNNSGNLIAREKTTR